jgi:hypothetical protein
VKLEFNLVTVDFFIQNRCLNNPTVDIKRKTAKEKYLHASRNIYVLKTRSINEGKYLKSNHDKIEKSIK